MIHNQNHQRDKCTATSTVLVSISGAIPHLLNEFNQALLLSIHSAAILWASSMLFLRLDSSQ